jgi:hypothetical protein
VITRLQRAWVVVLLVLLVVPGVIGFDLWPLTGWRLFSLSRDATQTEWALDARRGDAFEEIDLEQLPMAFRNAAWPMATLPSASPTRRTELCEALLLGVRSAITDVRELALVREVRHLEVVDGEESISEEREVLVRCD